VELRLFGGDAIGKEPLGKRGDDARRRFAKRRRTQRIGRIGPKGGANDRPTRREGPPRPPDVQGGDVAVPDGFFAPRVRRDALDGQVNFDEALGVRFLNKDLKRFVSI